MDSAQDTLDRIERERAYHNERFTEETRQAEGKFYFAIKDGATAFSDRVSELAVGARVLEYGCGNASQARALARVAKSVDGIDISDVAIAEASEIAKAEGLTNFRFQTMNAEAMTFEQGSFDLIFGRGIIHHLDLKRSFAELARVLAPGGSVLLWEPLGHNLAINAYRAVTPSARTPDEHPLLAKDFNLARGYFDDVGLKFYGLTSLATVPVRDTNLGEKLLRASAAVDQALFRVPGMKWQAWYTLIELRKPRHG